MGPMANRAEAGASRPVGRGTPPLPELPPRSPARDGCGWRLTCSGAEGPGCRPWVGRRLLWPNRCAARFTGDGGDGRRVGNKAWLCGGTGPWWGGGTTVMVRPGHPMGRRRAIKIAAGRYHSLALKRDGTVVGWGDSLAFQSLVGSGLAPAVSIVAGRNVSYVACADGRIVMTGVIRPGRARFPPSVFPGGRNCGGWWLGAATGARVCRSSWAGLPEGVTHAVALGAGLQPSLAVSSDDTRLAWGDNSFGRARSADDLGPVVSVTAGDDLNVAQVVERVLFLPRRVRPTFHPGTRADSLVPRVRRTCLRGEVSADLRHWMVLIRTECTNGLARIRDTGALGGPRRVYRSMVTP